MALILKSLRRLATRGQTPPAARAPFPAFADLSEHLDPALLPPLDQPRVDEAALTPEQAAWRRDGAVILPRFLPEPLRWRHPAWRSSDLWPARGTF